MNYIDATKNWIEKFVIGLNLCPFAKQPFVLNKIRYVVYEGQDAAELLEKLKYELRYLLATKGSETETSLIILPNMLADFDDYMYYMDLAESVASQMELDGILQLATFHPMYQFEGTDHNAVENYTNRSPYPCIHILREESVTRAVDNFPDIESIPENNIETMNRLGLDAVKRMLED